jgi:hypothetical protein
MVPREQGRFFTPDEIANIKRLLISTELSFGDIAVRMGCSKSTIVAINRKSNIRSYGGRRNSWLLAIESQVPQVPD